MILNDSFDDDMLNSDANGLFTARQAKRNER